MARVTVEDCIEIVNNRFELVILASQRAKAISSGAPITIERDNDKNAVIALREIAAETVNVESLRNILINSFQRKNKFDALEPEFENAISKDDEIEIEAELGDYKIENIDTIEDALNDDFSFENDNFETDD